MRGRVYFPRLQVSGSVSFLVDTGADSSALHTGDVRRLQIDVSKLKNPTKLNGIGGTAVYYQEDVLLVFVEPKLAVHAYRLVLEVAHPTQRTLRLPSILGRDVIDRWRMTYDPSTANLSFDVLSADASAPLLPRRRRPP